MDTKIYRLFTLYNHEILRKNGYYSRSSEEYFVGEKGLKIAKRNFDIVRKDKEIDVVEINLCDIDHKGKIVPIERIDIFINLSGKLKEFS